MGDTDFDLRVKQLLTACRCGQALAYVPLVWYLITVST